MHPTTLQYLVKAGQADTRRARERGRCGQAPPVRRPAGSGPGQAAGRVESRAPRRGQVSAAPFLLAGRPDPPGEAPATRDETRGRTAALDELCTALGAR